MIDPVVGRERPRSPLCPSPQVKPGVRVSRTGLPRARSPHDAAIFRSCVDILALPLCAGDVSSRKTLVLLPCFPMHAAFPRSEYYQGIRLPPRRLPSCGWSFQLAYSTPAKTPMDLPGSSDASVSTRAVPLDPAGISGRHRHLSAAFSWPSTCSSVSASGRLSRGSSGFTCVTARVSPCLRLTHVVTSMRSRLGSRWTGLALAGAGIAPTGSAGLRLAHRSILRYRRLRRMWLYGQWP